MTSIVSPRGGKGFPAFLWIKLPFIMFTPQVMWTSAGLSPPQSFLKRYIDRAKRYYGSDETTRIYGGNHGNKDDFRIRTRVNWSERKSSEKARGSGGLGPNFSSLSNYARSGVEKVCVRTLATRARKREAFTLIFVSSLLAIEFTLHFSY